MLRACRTRRLRTAPADLSDANNGNLGRRGADAMLCPVKVLATALIELVQRANLLLLKQLQCLLVCPVCFKVCRLRPCVVFA